MSGRQYVDKITLQGAGGDVSFFVVSGDPNGVVPGNIGDQVIRNDAPSLGVYENISGATAWRLLSRSGGGTVANSTAIPGSDTGVQSFDEVIDVPVNRLVSGTVIDLAARVDFSIVGAADNYAVALGWNGTQLISFGFVAAPAGPFTGSAYLKARFTVDGSGLATLRGVFYEEALVLSAPPVPGFLVPVNRTPLAIAINTAIANQFRVVFQWAGGADATSTAILGALSATITPPGS